MAHIIRAERPDGSRVPFDLDHCIEYPLSADDQRSLSLLHRQDNDTWVYRELVWTMTVRNNRPYRPQETLSECRVVTWEQARGMFRQAGKDIPPALSDDVTSGNAARAGQGAQIGFPTKRTEEMIEKTLELMPRGALTENLIWFLIARERRTANQHEVCEHIYKSKGKGSLVKTRLLIKRAAVRLEKHNAPLRITYDKKFREIRIIID
jgi:hypothetical protein